MNIKKYFLLAFFISLIIELPIFPSPGVIGKGNVKRFYIGKDGSFCVSIEGNYASNASTEKSTCKTSNPVALSNKINSDKKYTTFCNTGNDANKHLLSLVIHSITTETPFTFDVYSCYLNGIGTGSW